MTLIRTEHGRGYVYTLDGEPVKGAPSLISGGLPKPGLASWGAKLAARYVVDNWRSLAPSVAAGHGDAAFEEIRRAPFRQKRHAKDRGLDVHRRAEAFPCQWAEDEELNRYVVSCRSFLKDWGVTSLVVGAVVGSRAHAYAGTLDLVARRPNGEVALFDYSVDKDVYPDAALRAAAYRHAEFFLHAGGAEVPMPLLGITAAYAVLLRPDGYVVHPLTTDRETFRRFLEVAAVARGTKTLPALVHDPVTPTYLPIFRDEPRIAEGLALAQEGER